MTTTSDPTDPRLTHGVDDADGPPKAQAEVYLVLSEEDRARGFMRPLRRAYWHTTCRLTTTMNQAIAETYATNPYFYWATYCAPCGLHRPVGPDGEFYWCNPDDPAARDESYPKVGT